MDFADPGVDFADPLNFEIRFEVSESFLKRERDRGAANPSRPQANPWTMATDAWTLPTTVQRKSMSYGSYPVDFAGQSSTRLTNIFN